MKLHLPKALLTAVLLVGACVSTANAATKYLITDSSTETSYTLAGGSGKYDGDDLLYDKADATITSDADIAASGYIWVGPGAGDSPSRQSSSQHSEVTLNGTITGNSGRIQFNIYGNSVAYRLTNSASTYSGTIQLGRGTNETGIVQLSLAGTGTAFQDAVFSNNDAETAVFSIESDVSIGGIWSSGESSRITSNSADNVLKINNKDDFTWKNAVGSGAYYAAGSTTTSDSTALSIAKTGTGTQTFAGTTNLHDVTVTEGTLALEGTTTISGEISVAETATLSINKAITLNGSLTSGAITLSSLENLQTTGKQYSGSQIEGNGILTAAYSIFTTESTQKAGLSIKYAGVTYTTDAEGRITTGDAELFEINSQTENFSTVKAAGGDKVQMAGGTGLAVDQDGTLASVKAASGTVTISGAKNLTVTNFSADGIIKKTDAGKLTLKSVSKLGGEVQVTGGTLEIQSGGQKLNTANVSGGTLQLTGSDIINYSGDTSITVSNNATLQLDARQSVDSANTFTLNGGNISGTGGKYEHGATSYTVGLEVHDASTMTITSTGTSSVSTAIGLRDGSGAVKFDVTSGTLTNSGGVAGNGKVVKSGAGTMVMSAASTHAGGTEITGGVLKTANAAALSTGTVKLNGGNLHLQSDLGVSSLELTNGQIIFDSGATLTVTNAITLDASAIALASDITFSSTDEQDLLTVSGGLTASNVDSWTGGSYTIDGKTYIAGLEQRDNTLWLTFDLDESGSSSITSTVQSASLTGTVLTLNIDGELTAGCDVDLTLSEQALADIYGMTGEVDLSLVASNGTFSSVEGSENYVNVGFYNGAYTGEVNGKFRVEYIPEPATATLSLLALAGLAARRRRR